MSMSFICRASLATQLQSSLYTGEVHATGGRKRGLERVKNLIIRNGVPSVITSPLESLQNGNWVKLICGASFEDVVDIRNLSLVYTLAGVDCIDCAAEASVVSAVNEGIEAARVIVPIRRPWVMISVNDDEDLHFRKADTSISVGISTNSSTRSTVDYIINGHQQIKKEFDPNDCPLDCSRPCENICPAHAILSLGAASGAKGGVVAERCYGCGRCLPVCPYDKIKAITYIRDITATAELLKRDDVDAIEIHTSGRQDASFRDLWNGLGDSIDNLRLVAVSFPDLRDSTISAMNAMYSAMKANLRCFNLWQLDGRPMSGDIGRGATRETIAFASYLAAARDKPEGFLQLAGGTNAHTVEGLKKKRLFQTKTIFDESVHLHSISSSHALISGVAFGGYARKIVGRVLSSLQSEDGRVFIENYPDHLVKALVESLALVGTVKCYGK